MGYFERQQELIFAFSQVGGKVTPCPDRARKVVLKADLLDERTHIGFVLVVRTVRHLIFFGAPENAFLLVSRRFPPEICLNE